MSDKYNKVNVKNGEQEIVPGLQPEFEAAVQVAQEIIGVGGTPQERSTIAYRLMSLCQATKQLEALRLRAVEEDPELYVDFPRSTTEYLASSIPDVLYAALNRQNENKA